MYASAIKKPLSSWAGKGSQGSYAESSPLSSLHQVSGKHSAASFNENKSQKIAEVVNKITSSHAAPGRKTSPNSALNSDVVNSFESRGHHEAVRIFTLPDSQLGRQLPALPSSAELGLTESEISAIKVYTSSNYTLLNKYERSRNMENYEVEKLVNTLIKNGFLKSGFVGKESLESGVKNFNQVLDRSRKKHPSNESFGNVVVRGIGFDYPFGEKEAKQYATVGAVIGQKSYTSTSVSTPYLNTHLLILEAPPEAEGHWIAPTSVLPRRMKYCLLPA
ncbi:ADP-ribosyltransferase [Kosakonia cowanii]|uniref:ADP-ribosyltransferase n=1 Tax=Kosakonia cowanii TaxID=208223 RepID=UPI0039B79465